MEAGPGAPGGTLTPARPHPARRQCGQQYRSAIMSELSDSDNVPYVGHPAQRGQRHHPRPRGRPRPRPSCAASSSVTLTPALGPGHLARTAHFGTMPPRPLQGPGAGSLGPGKLSCPSASLQWTQGLRTLDGSAGGILQGCHVEGGRPAG